MMRRLFWVGLGAVGAVLVVRYVARTAEAYTPAGVARSASKMTDAIRDFGAEIRVGMAEREAELRTALLDEPSSRLQA